MSRSFLAAIRSAIFSTPDTQADPETPITLAAPAAPALPVHASAPALPVATHPAAAADHGRFATVAQAEGIAGSSKRIAAALELAAIAPDMSSEAIIAWIVTHVPVADAPARTIPTLMERAEEAQRQADALGASTDNARNGWGPAISEAHRRHKIH
jgi:hypothetical protein